MGAPMSKSSPSRSFEEIEVAIIEAIAPLFNPDPGESAYYAPYYVNQRENARRVIGNMPFSERIAFARFVFARRFPADNDGEENTIAAHAREAAEHAVMLSLAFEDAPDAIQAKARSAFVLASMADNMEDIEGLRMPDHWRDDALRTLTRDLELIAASKRGLSAVAA